MRALGLFPSSTGHFSRDAFGIAAALRLVAGRNGPPTDGHPAAAIHVLSFISFIHSFVPVPFIHPTALGTREEEGI